MGDSPAMRELRAMLASGGPTEANVMVLGENGVGKEFAARALHQASRRAAGPMLAVDMGAVPEATSESELFGHRKGAFPDAKHERAGRFRAARGGALFLDAIGNLPLAAQAKLLTALERREVTPLGADRPEAIDVRILSATNIDKARRFDPAAFRPDLLFRLNTIVLRARRQRRRSITCNSMTGRATYARSDFGLFDSHAQAAAVPATPAYARQTLGALERDAIHRTLEQVDGNISHAAKALGISRAALYRKLSKHGI